MEEERLTCELITPMFSYGAYKENPEFRTSQLKGVMRYVYRITCPSSIGKLKTDEKELFGSGADSVNKTNQNNKQAVGHASFIQLSIKEKEKVKTAPQALLLHRNQDAMKCLKEGEFVITIRLNPAIRKRDIGGANYKIGIDWYTDLLILSLTLCGLGRRSRKGRGSVVIEDKIFKDKKSALDWICTALNKIARASSENFGELYTCKGDKIQSQYDYQGSNRSSQYDYKKSTRPLIQKIEIGKELKRNHIINYLRAVDIISHEVKKDEKKCDECKRATGSGDPKLASPLLISILQIKKEFFPIYTFVNAVLKEKNGKYKKTNTEYKEIDKECKERNEFIERVEKKLKELI